MAIRVELLFYLFIGLLFYEVLPHSLFAYVLILQSIYQDDDFNEVKILLSFEAEYFTFVNDSNFKPFYLILFNFCPKPCFITNFG